MVNKQTTLEFFEMLGLSEDYERQKYLVFEQKNPIKHEDHFILLDNVSHTD